MALIVTVKCTTDLDHAVGLRIATLRKAKGLSQTALGAVAGVTFQQIQKYEKGVNRVSGSRLQQIAQALEVPMSILFGESEPKVLNETFGFLSEIGAVLRIYGLLAKNRRDTRQRDMSNISYSE